MKETSIEKQILANENENEESEADGNYPTRLLFF
jgi:hypothetical protein